MIELEKLCNQAIRSGSRRQIVKQILYGCLGETADQDQRALAFTPGIDVNFIHFFLKLL